MAIFQGRCICPIYIYRDILQLDKRMPRYLWLYNVYLQHLHTAFHKSIFKEIYRNNFKQKLKYKNSVRGIKSNISCQKPKILTLKNCICPRKETGEVDDISRKDIPFSIPTIQVIKGAVQNWHNRFVFSHTEK